MIRSLARSFVLASSLCAALGGGVVHAAPASSSTHKSVAHSKKHHATTHAKKARHKSAKPSHHNKAR